MGVVVLRLLEERPGCLVECLGLTVLNLGCFVLFVNNVRRWPVPRGRKRQKTKPGPEEEAGGRAEAV